MSTLQFVDSIGSLRAFFHREIVKMRPVSVVTKCLRGRSFSMRNVTILHDATGPRFVRVTQGHGAEFAEMMRVFELDIRPTSIDGQGDCFEFADPSQTAKIELGCKLWRQRQTAPPQ